MLVILVGSSLDGPRSGAHRDAQDKNKHDYVMHVDGKGQSIESNDGSKQF